MKQYIVIETDDDNLINELSQTQEVVGCYRAPTAFCGGTCTKASRRVTGFVRGRKWGWWICSVCHKPTNGWGTNHKAVISSSVNLVPSLLQKDKNE